MEPSPEADLPHLPPKNFRKIKYKCKQCFMCYFSATVMMSVMENNGKKHTKNIFH